MDKTVLRNFAIESRKDLMEKIDRKIKLFYIDEEFKKDNRGDVIVLSNDKHTLTLTKDEDSNRDKLLKRIIELGYDQVVEEAAYTWFNRIIAIRYMEIHDYLPLTADNQSIGVNVLSSADNSANPDILKFTTLSNPNLDINFNKEKYAELSTTDEKFKYILLLICRKLGKVIPQVFDGITDYIDLLIPDNLLLDGNFIYNLIKNIPSSYFDKVEIIGWLYQYYNQSEKDRVISAKKVYKKHEIAYATQLFTPDWIVKYMVDNSLGKYWIERNKESALTNKLNYFISDSTEKKLEYEDPTNITFIDPCCGSGHILVYAFELFYQMYEEAGYNKKDIASLILEKNIYGLDIDDRAGQLSILSIVLKAREYDKNIFNNSIIKDLNILSIQESRSLDEFAIDSLDEPFKTQANNLKETYMNAKEFGSLILTDNLDYTELINCVNSKNTIETVLLREPLINLIKQNKILSNKYSIVVTNPPYLNNNLMSTKMKDYLAVNYNDVKSDLFSSFIVRNLNFGKDNSYFGFMTPYVWMFIGTYQKLREKILEQNIDSLIQLEYSALEEATVPICSFTVSKSSDSTTGIYFRLTDYKGGMEVQKKMYLQNLNEKKYYIIDKKILKSLPESIIAYWITERMQNVFKNEPLGNLVPVKKGADTGNNNKYLREWYEVDYNNIKFYAKPNEQFKQKWVPYNKGGEYRKWYGNNDIIINWENDGYELKHSKANLRSQHLYFKSSITWSALTSSNTSFRLSDYGAIFDSAGSSMFPDEHIYYYLALCNSVVSKKILDMINPTLNFGAGSIAKIPIVIDDIEEIENYAKDNVQIVKNNWNGYEISWEFDNKYFVNNHSLVEDNYNDYKNQLMEKFNQLKNNEEMINKKIISNYKLEDEIDYRIDEKDISLIINNEKEYVKNLISYSVGCMFGRYSLDDNGIVYAGGCYDKNRYKTIIPDEDNIIPLSETESVYYNDDVVGRFKEFIKIAFGEDTLNENLNFIADNLGKRGTESSEDTIRRYFVNEFYNDHLKTYQKRPIYWLFDSGKKNGFKCLVYLHRYDEQIVSKIRTKYLHNTISIYQRILEEIDYKLNNTELSTIDKRELQNKKQDLNGKITECNEYDEMVGNVANKMIKLDLDDGVIINYAKFVDDNGKSILAKIK